MEGLDRLYGTAVTTTAIYLNALLKWRKHEIKASSSIEKMLRMMRVHLVIRIFNVYCTNHIGIWQFRGMCLLLFLLEGLLRLSKHRCSQLIVEFTFAVKELRKAESSHQTNEEVVKIKSI